MTPSALSSRDRSISPRGLTYSTLSFSPKRVDDARPAVPATDARTRADGRPMKSLVLAVESALAPTRALVAASLERARAEEAELVLVVAGPVGESDIVEWTAEGARCVLAGRDASLADLRRIGARHARGDVLTMLGRGAHAASAGTSRDGAPLGGALETIPARSGDWCLKAN